MLFFMHACTNLFKQLAADYVKLCDFQKQCEYIHIQAKKDEKKKK